MLEKPLLEDALLKATLAEAYGLQVEQLVFLPLGADINTAVYRAEARGQIAYFLKLRKGHFEETSMLVPRFLYDSGIHQIIQPMKTVDGRLWANLNEYTCILYPFIEGSDGFHRQLSDEQWVEFGKALNRIHTLTLPEDLRDRIPSETWSPFWRERVRAFQVLVEEGPFIDPLAARMAAFMRSKRQEISTLIERAGQLGEILRAQPLPYALCHSDIHADNLLLGEDNSFFLVDWDQPILAPPERDLMFIGAGIGETWYRKREEELFYQGYGHKKVNLTALAYYRYERIVQDIAEFSNQILNSLDGGQDREQGFRFFSGQFSPGDVIDIAHRTYQQWIESEPA